MFSKRWLKESDYEQLCDWWTKWRWTPPTRALLPENGTFGIMISVDGINVCAGFLYLTNSSFGIVEYIVSNFDFKDRELRKEAIKMLIESLNDVAYLEGVDLIFTSVKDPNLIKSNKECGYVIGSVGTTEMLRKI